LFRLYTDDRTKSSLPCNSTGFGYLQNNQNIQSQKPYLFHSIIWYRLKNS